MQLVVVEPDDHRAVHEPDPGRHRAGTADRRGHPLGALEVARVRQPLSDHAGLERDDRPGDGHRQRDLVGDEQAHAGASAGHCPSLPATSAPA